MNKRFLVGFGLAAAAIAVMGQVGLTTMPPNTIFGRLGVGAFGPGGAIPIATLAANLGIGATNHAVPIGKGSTVAGYNSAVTGTAGQLLVDQGSGIDPAFVPMTGACTLAANGAISCSGVGGGVTAVSGNYTALPGDCLKTIAAGGNTQLTITVNSAATYGACTMDISNVDTWGSGRGKILAVTGLTTRPAVLYPGMTITLTNISGVWFQKPGVSISRAPVNTKLYVDGVNGLDTNDCLTTANACKTLQYVVMTLLYENLVVASGSATPSPAGFDIRLINDPACVTTTGANCIAGLHMSGVPKQVEGHNAILIECDSGSATNCTIADNTGGQAIGMYCNCFLELANVTLAAGSGNNNDIQVEKGMVRIEAGVVLGGIPVNAVAQLNAVNGGSIVVDGGANVLSVSGGANWFAAAQSGGNIQLDQTTVRWIGNANYAAILASFGSLITATGMSWQPNGFTIVAPHNVQCSPGGFIDTGGSVASIPGTNSPLGCTSSANGQVN